MYYQGYMPRPIWGKPTDLLVMWLYAYTNMFCFFLASMTESRYPMVWYGSGLALALVNVLTFLYTVLFVWVRIWHLTQQPRHIPVASAPPVLLAVNADEAWT